jgi:hypothetical protein
MKHSIKQFTLQGLITLLMLFFMQSVLFAQDQGGGTGGGTGGGSAEGGGGGVNVNITENGGDWYAQPWVWIVGVALFVLLLIALLRGGSDSRNTTGRTERVTVTKQTSSDSDANL